MIKTKLNIEALPDEFVESLATKDDINDINSALTDVDTALSDKQDVLISGTNIKTVNGTTLLGKGNINIPIYDDTEIVQSIQEIQEHISENEEVVAETLTDLDTNKASKSDVAQMIGTSTETLETLQNITEYIVNNGQEAANLVENVQINAENIDETKKMAVDSKTLDISYAENDIDIHYNAIDGGEYSLKIEVATEESAGMMSAEDKREQVKKTPLVNGDIIVGQTREIHSRNGKTVSDSFLARTTAGSGTIGDGVASLKSVGGNIVKNNNNVQSFIGSFSYQDDIITALPYENGIVQLFVSPTNDYNNRSESFTTTSGHIYYNSCYIKTNDELADVFVGKSNNGFGYVPNKAQLVRTTDWQHASYRLQSLGSAHFHYAIGVKNTTSPLYVAKVLHIDLTEMFGAGNEPTKEECDRLFSTMDALPQGLTIAKPTEFKSIGFNQFNPDNVLDGKAIVDNTIVSGDKMIAVIPCLPCKVGVGENNGYCIHGDFGDDIKVYLTPLNPMEVEGELYMHELTKDATTDTYVPQIKGYMLVEVPTTANLCAHFLWSEDKCERYTYEPYFESKVELPVIPQMSEWGLVGIQSSGTLAADTIDFERGVYVKRIHKRVFDGSERWNLSGKLFYSGGIKPLNKKNGNQLGSWNGYFKTSVVTPGAINLNNETTSSVLYIVPLESVGVTDVAAWKAYLAQNPLELYYELAEPEEYPLPKVDNNYISSDYGVEQFDSIVPCNANNLYYMRSLAGETRNFLDRLYDNTDKTDAKEVADYITSGIEGNKPNLALRTLFVAAGAEYNDTDQIIQKTAPWGETVQHLPKHYYLNGLGDITEEEMMDIYIYTMDRYSTNDLTNFCRKQQNTDKEVRTNLRNKNFFINSNSEVSLICSCMNNKKIEVFCVNHTNLANISNINYLIENATSCKAVIGIIEIKMKNQYTLKNTPKLEYIKIKSLKDNINIGESPLINTDSILYMIQNASPTSAITITLHPEAYARLADDADIVAALDTKNAALATEGKGGSINLISV